MESKHPVERAIPDVPDAIAEMIDLSTDMLWRYLSDRDGLSVSATLVLNRLNRQGPMRLTALASAEGVSQSGMTQLVQRMEGQGLLERSTDPDDGRASLVMIGETGRRFCDARTNRWRQRIAELLPAVCRDDQTALWLATQVVVRILGQMTTAADRQAQVGAELTG